MTNEETEVKLELPKVIMNLLRACEKNAEEYLVHSIMCAVTADLDAGTLVDPESPLSKICAPHQASEESKRLC
jgi:hypothetical protein